MKRLSTTLGIILLVLLAGGVMQARMALAPKLEIVEVPADLDPVSPAPGAKDGIYIYGGPGTLEGKFQTAAMEPDPQGWTTHDLTEVTDIPDEFQIDDFYCANLDPGVPGNHAWWCGDYYNTLCDPGEEPGGYGNLIDAGLEWKGAVPAPLEPTIVNLEFALNHDLEGYYDWLFVEYYSEVGGYWIEVASYTGVGYGLSEAVGFSVQPDEYSGDQDVRLRFRVVSDYAWSSEDCGGGYYEGACQIDNIQVSFDTGSGPVPQGPAETCEPGDAQDWTPVNYANPLPVGDFAKVWPLLEESVPGALNDTPRWAFIDDGVVVPELPGYTNGFPYGPGGFCVNADGGLAGPGHLIDNEVWSPVIPVPAGDWTSIYYEYEEYVHQIPSGGGYPVFSSYGIRSTADPTGASGWSPWHSTTVYYGGPNLVQRVQNVTTMVVSGFACLQLSLGVMQYPGFPVTLYSSPAPYFDNAAVRLVGTPFTPPEPELSITPETSGPLNCSDTLLLTFRYAAPTGAGDLFLYNLVIRAGGELAFGPIVNLHPFGGTEYFFTVNNGDGTWTVTGSTVANPSSPIAAPADLGLFTIEFAVVGDGAPAVTFDQVDLRDPANNPLPSSWTGAAATTDCTPPSAVTGIQADPAHGKVHVSWQHDQLDVDHYAVFRGLWYDGSPATSAYPEYDDQPGDVIPARPASLAGAQGSPEWELAGSAPAGTLEFTDSGMATGRGVYYYEVFPVDAAGNAGAPAAANDRATNYWLGDVDPIDGEVDAMDVNFLGTHFGSPVPLDDPRNVADVGPTDDWGPRSIPLTDSVLDFEDLMVFALNFGVVTPAKLHAPASPEIRLAWTAGEDGSLTLELVDGQGLVGLHLRAGGPVAGLAVESGGLLKAQDHPTFLRNIGGGLDLSLAVLGREASILGRGPLCTLRSADTLDPATLAIEARGRGNVPLDVVIGAAGPAALPRAFALNANFPNPFNPSTTLSFSLPTEQHVRLAIFGLDGKRIRTVVDGPYGPGRHEAVWTGQDDHGRPVASGTYLCRMEAGPFRQVRKISLTK